MTFDLRPGTGAAAGWIEARVLERPHLVRFGRDAASALAAIRAAVAAEDARGRASQKTTAKEC